MEIRYPNYYKKFTCIAGNCPDTCCAGWEIPVDRRSEQRYKDIQKKVKNREFAGKLKKYIKHGRILSEDVTCPFLNGDGLCEMYLEVGPEALCRTCARYPRHVEDYGNLHEVVLLLSCPEVARLVLEENEGGFYARNLPERHGNMAGIDERLLACLLQVRGEILDMSANPSMPLENCLMYAVALAHDVQRRFKREAFAEIRSILKRYKIPGASERIALQWKRDADGNQRFLLMSDFMEALSGLEPICCDWPGMLEHCRAKIYHAEDSRARYAERHRCLHEAHPETDRDLRKVFEYYLYSFVLSALYDGDVLTKVKMAVLCTLAIADLYAAADLLDRDERVNICHALARQIENSDENRAALERFLKCGTFSARRIMEVLASWRQSLHWENLDEKNGRK